MSGIAYIRHILGSRKNLGKTSGKPLTNQVAVSKRKIVRAMMCERRMEREWRESERKRERREQDGEVI